MKQQPDVDRWLCRVPRPRKQQQQQCVIAPVSRLRLAVMADDVCSPIDVRGFFFKILGASNG